jgi:uncharacterized protein
VTWKPDLVITHASCQDGHGAAWAAWKRWGDAVQYLPCSYGDSAPVDAVMGKNVLVADFSWKQDVMRKLGTVVETMIVVDHHKSAQGELQEWATPADWLCRQPANFIERTDFGSKAIIAHFDMEKSGARMAWEFCHPCVEVPRLIEHIEDRDLWRFKLPDTRAVHAAISSFDFEFWLFDDFAADLDLVIGEGRAILRAHDRQVKELCEFSYEAEIGGISGVRVLNAPYFFASDCGHKLLEMFPDAPFAAVWSRRSDGKDQYSLRARAGGVDVSKVAEKFGGGGHAAASGFAVEAGVTPSEAK